MIGLLEDMGISMTINVAYLHEFNEDVPLYLGPCSRTSSFAEGRTDEGQNMYP